jgi:stage II sporulation protein AA (anti-sigma F factor antagonist)
MHINVEHYDNYAILHLRGEFDSFYCRHLQQEIDALIQGGIVRVVLSLRLVKFINSTALGAIIKASKSLTSRDGKLVLARPSPFCREIVEKVGLDRVVPIFDTEETAVEAVLSGRKSVSDKGAEGAVEDEGSLLFSLVDAARLDHFLTADKTQMRVPLAGKASSQAKAWSSVGRLSSLDENGVRFTWNGGDTELEPFAMGQLLAIGTDLRIKFRLPLFEQGYCEATATISEIEERGEGVKVGASFSKIERETLDAVRQYAKDLKYLKDELRKATGGK